MIYKVANSIYLYLIILIVRENFDGKKESNFKTEGGLELAPLCHNPDGGGGLSQSCLVHSSLQSKSNSAR